MAISIKIDPVERSTVASVRADLSLPEQKREVAAFAQAGLQEAQQVNRAILGRVPPHTTTVDGRRGAPLESVNPDGGSIIFEFELMFDVLRWIADALVERSPHISGAYKRGHTIFADGQEIKLGGAIPQAEEYAFTNYVPYARKLEIGTTKAGRAFLLQVPNRIYERTAKDARARFGNIAKILFTYRGIVSGAQINPLKAGATGLVRGAKGRFVERGGVRAHHKSDVRFPTITVYLPR